MDDLSGQGGRRNDPKINPAERTNQSFPYLNLVYQERLTWEEETLVPLIDAGFPCLEETQNLFTLDEHPSALVPLSEQSSYFPPVKIPLDRQRLARP
jgi:hypothetical protein